jgi:uncharacterized membrane protein YfcA
LNYVLAVVGLGLGVGVLVGATGIGGGTLLAPVLIFVLRLNPFVSVGTDLFVSAITKIVGALVHRRANNVDTKLAWPLCIAGVVGAILGTVLLTTMKYHVDVAAAQGLLKRVIGVALLICAAFVVISLNEKFRFAVRNEGRYAGFVGLLVAIVTTITGVGVGSLSVPALYLISGRRATAMVVGTSLVFGAVVTALAAIAHVALHDVDYGLSGLLLVGGVPGVWIGSRIGARATNYLRPTIAALLVIVGLKLVL